jgi:hypothetical protein
LSALNNFMSCLAKTNLKKYLYQIYKNMKMSSKVSLKKKYFEADHFESIVSTNLSETSFSLLNSLCEKKDIFQKFLILACLLTNSGLCCYFILKTFINFFSYDVLLSNTLVSDIPAECKLTSFILISQITLLSQTKCTCKSQLLRSAI